MGYEQGVLGGLDGLGFLGQKRDGFVKGRC